ncbi:protease inhibitor I42 family protein [Nocardia terpenica]|nr:protease inhibitor I42 family protein [Nocardia terpenica]NQE87276.1 protease inhibitor I42 family protein [Nocardia terpenica]
MRTPLLMVAFGVALAAGGTNAVAWADPAAGPAVATPISEPMIVGTDADGQTVTLTVGQELAIALPDNPSTGYRWQLADFDQGVMHQEGDPQFRPTNIMPGSPGTSVWTFTASAPGNTRLDLVSLPPAWQPGTPPPQHFSVNASVH